MNKEGFVYLYTVRDKLAEQAGNLFEAVNDSVAVRHFNALIRPDDPVRKEFQLLKVGTYNRFHVTINIYDEVVDITPLNKE